MNTLTFTIFSTTKNLPETWDDVLHSNIFLSKKYLEALESASPINMTCRYIAFYKDNVLVGKALAQCINLNNVTHLGVEEGCVKTKVRNFAFKNLCSHVLFLGNNMLTGQNAFCFAPTIKVSERINALHQAIEEVVKNFKEEGINIHITVCKDFEASEIDDFKQGNFSDYYQLSTQPTMEFRLNETWKTEEDYINVLQKKYRDQYKRARKKSESISKQKFSLHVQRNSYKINRYYYGKNYKLLIRSDFGRSGSDTIIRFLVRCSKRRFIRRIYYFTYEENSFGLKKIVS